MYYIVSLLIDNGQGAQAHDYPKNNTSSKMRSYMREKIFFQFSFSFVSEKSNIYTIKEKSKINLSLKLYKRECLGSE